MPQVIRQKGKSRDRGKENTEQGRACQNFLKMNISYSLIGTCMWAYQGIRNVFLGEGGDVAFFVSFLPSS